MTPEEFVGAYERHALASQAGTHVPALVTLGQGALESGWGKSAPKFNFFGIKAKATDPPDSRQLLRTREVMSRPDAKFPEVISVTKRPDGRYEYVVRDWFRAFPDATAAFRQHGEFLKNNPRYAKAFAKTDPFEFAGEIAKAGYATDPNYITSLRSVMKRIAGIMGA